MSELQVALNRNLGFLDEALTTTETATELVARILVEYSRQQAMEEDAFWASLNNGEEY